MKKQRETVLILHDIRSNHNVGSIFRTADAAGINKMFLSGYTPTPLDKYGRDVLEIAKTALGAEKNVKWEKEKNIKKIIKNLKNKKFQIIAIEQAKNSVDYKKVSARGGPAYGQKKIAFIFGNEVTGIPKNILSLCDVLAEIPMRGKKESLNVSVAAGISMFRILDI